VSSQHLTPRAGFRTLHLLPHDRLDPHVQRGNHHATPTRRILGNLALFQRKGMSPPWGGNYSVMRWEESCAKWHSPQRQSGPASHQNNGASGSSIFCALDERPGPAPGE
jgi:hypothetical protein